MGAEPSCLVAIRATGSKPPLFCIHWAGGQVDIYGQLAQLLEDDQPVYGLQALGLDGKTRPHTSIEEMADRYLQEITQLQPGGPYFLLGASMGGKVAWELGQRLWSDGRAPAFLGLVDTWGPYPIETLPMQDRFMLLSWRLAGLDARSRVAYLTRKMWRRLTRGCYRLLIRARVPLPRFMRNLTETTIIASRSYRPRPYAGKITLFRAKERRKGQPQDLFMRWDRLALGGIDLHELPGEHSTLLTKPIVHELAVELRKCLEIARMSA